MAFDFTSGSDVFSGATKSILSAASIALGDKLAASIGMAASRAHGGITGAVSKAAGGGVIGNILGSAIGNEVGGKLYSIAGSAVGLYAGTLSRTFQQIFTASDKMSGVAGMGFNIPNLISTTTTASGDLIASNLTNSLIMAGILPGSAAGVAIGSGLSGMFHSGEKEIDPFSMQNSPFKDPNELISQNKSLRAGRNLIFPRDLPNYFISFEFGNYEKHSPYQSGKVQKEGDRIFLPIPAQLQDDYHLQWSDVQRWSLGGLDRTKAEADMKTGEELLTGSGEGRIEAFKKIFDTTTNVGAYAVRSWTSTFGESVGASIGTFLGSIPNPHLAMLFGGVSFKSHQFSWRLIPNNKEETDIIRNIIKVFKVNASPVKESLFLHFPSVVFVTICVNGSTIEAPYLYAIKPCVIEGISVNYAPSGSPSFHSQGAPTAVDLSIKLKEIELWYRNDVGDERRSMSDIQGDVAKVPNPFC